MSSSLEAIVDKPATFDPRALTSPINETNESEFADLDSRAEIEKLITFCGRCGNLKRLTLRNVGELGDDDVRALLSKMCVWG